MNSFTISLGTGVGGPLRLTMRATPSVLLTLRFAWYPIQQTYILGIVAPDGQRIYAPTFS